MNDIYIYNTTDDDLYFPKRKKRPSADVMRTRTRREKERKNIEKGLWYATND